MKRVSSYLLGAVLALGICMQGGVARAETIGSGGGSLEPSNESIVEIVEQADGFPTDLPTRREHSWAAWLPITIGCNNLCLCCGCREHGTAQ